MFKKRIVLSMVIAISILSFSFAAKAQDEGGLIPIIIITPLILDFPDTLVDESSTVMTLKISKTNSLLPLRIYGLFNFRPFLFEIQNNGCRGAVLHNGESCNIDFTFNPRRERRYFSFLTIFNSSIFPIASAGLIGKGVDPEMELSDHLVNFGDHPVGSSSDPHGVTVTNIGTGNLIISDISLITGDPNVFTQSDDCIDVPISPREFCTINLVFSPNAIQSFMGTFSVVANANNSPQEIEVTGTGITAPSPALSVDKTALNFNTQIINTTSNPQTITASNSGDADLDITTVDISGPYGLQNNNCDGVTLAPTETCTFEVTFTPPSLGSTTGEVTFTVVQVIETPNVDLKGVGISSEGPNGSLSAQGVDFGEIQIETSSDEVTVTLTNTGGAPIIGDISDLEGANPDSFSMEDGCSGEIIPAQGSCTFTVQFHPTEPGNLEALVQIVNNAVNSPLFIRLIGIGVGQSISGGSRCSLQKSPEKPGEWTFAVLFLVLGVPALAFRSRIAS